MSVPAEKARPAPVRITARTDVSRSVSICSVTSAEFSRAGGWLRYDQKLERLTAACTFVEADLRQLLQQQAFYGLRTS